MSIDSSDLQQGVSKLKPKKIPLTCPNAPKLSENTERLQAIEQSNWLSNYGPVNTELEREFIRRVFDGRGACTTVNNATTGLILALKLAADNAVGKGRYVVMPSFTFAAAAHAVLWAGLIPLLGSAKRGSSIRGMQRPSPRCDTWRISVSEPSVARPCPA